MAICRIQYMHNDKLIRAPTLEGKTLSPVYDLWKLCIIVQRCSYFAIPIIVSDIEIKKVK